MSFQCLHVFVEFSHRQKGKSLLKFSSQHNSEQNKKTGDKKKKLMADRKQRGELTLLVISR